jgi:hypothetical protein
MTERLSQKLTTTLDIVQAMSHEKLFGQWYPGESWDHWKAVLRACYCLPMSDEDKTFFQSIAGGRDIPKEKVKELWIIAGRRAGKDSVASLICAYSAALFDQQHKLRPGEKCVCLQLAVDRAQAQICLGYIKSFFATIPALKGLVTKELQDGLELRNGCDITVATSSFKSIRGRSVLLAVMDELAFWSDETTSNPDTEVYNAVLPGLVTVDGMIVAISTPHARRGLLHRKWVQHFGKNSPRAVCIQAETRLLNPTIDQAVIDAAMEEELAVAKSEWGAEFRSDLESFVSQEAVDAVVVAGRLELAPKAGVHYFGFIDAAGGSGGPSGDSFTAAVAHREGEIAVLDAVRELKPKPSFSPEGVITSVVAPLFEAYGVRRCKADRWAGGFPVDRCLAHGIRLEPSERTKSELYSDFLAVLNSHCCQLLDLPRLKSQLLSLERSIRSGGKDLIDHPRGQHDDLINAAVGALLQAGGRQPLVITKEHVAMVAARGPRGGGTSMSLESRMGEKAYLQMRRGRRF